MGKSYTYQDVEKAAHNIRKNVLKLTLERNGCYLAQACSSARNFSYALHESIAFE